MRSPHLTSLQAERSAKPWPARSWWCCFELRECALSSLLLSLSFAFTNCLPLLASQLFSSGLWSADSATTPCDRSRPSGQTSDLRVKASEPFSGDPRGHRSIQQLVTMSDTEDNQSSIRGSPRSMELSNTSQQGTASQPVPDGSRLSDGQAVNQPPTLDVTGRSSPSGSRRKPVSCHTP